MSAARCAIKMRSAESDTKRATELLQQDLHNGSLHCFGIHTHCSTDCCKIVRTSTTTTTTNTHATTSSEEGTSELGEADAAHDIAAQEEQFWRDAIGLEAVRSVARN